VKKTPFFHSFQQVYKNQVNIPFLYNTRVFAASADEIKKPHIAEGSMQDLLQYGAAVFSFD